MYVSLTIGEIHEGCKGEGGGMNNSKIVLLENFKSLEEVLKSETTRKSLI